MTSYQQALDLYHSIGEDENSLMLDMAWHAHNGYVYASPLGLAMARPVSSSWSPELICDHTEQDEELLNLTHTLDCWHIHCVVGDLTHLLSLLPYELPYISMERKGVFKIYKSARLHEIAKATRTRTDSTASD